jgi:hypothetical protein
MADPDHLGVRSISLSKLAQKKLREKIETQSWKEGDQ